MKQKILLQYYKILAFFAKKYLNKHTPIIIGINWSVGKTSCRTIIHQTLQKFFPEKRIYTSTKNFNGELGLPLSVFCKESRTPNIFEFIKTFFSLGFQAFFWKKKYEVILLEYGIDRPKEMDFLLNIAKPQIWVFTALDAVHSEQFWDPNAIAQEEVKMPLNTTELVFLNNDEPYTQQIIEDINVDKLTYQTLWNPSLSWNSWKEKTADIFFDTNEFITTKDGKIKSSFQLNIRSKKYAIITNQIGKINCWYIGVALAITETLAHKFWKKEILKNSKENSKENNKESRNIINLEYQLLPGRMSIFAGLEDSILLDSTYNASPLSMRRLIDTTYTLKGKKQVWLALWDMRELGDFSEKEHRLLAWYCMWIADKIFLVGELMKKYFFDEIEKIGFDMKNIHHFDTSILLAKEIKKQLKTKNDKTAIILLKWSQNTIFLEEATKYLLKNKKEKNQLVRQSKFWIKKKET